MSEPEWAIHRTRRELIGAVEEGHDRIAQLERDCELLAEGCDRGVARIAQLEQYKEWAEPQIVQHGKDLERIAALEAALLKYGGHLPYCAKSQQMPTKPNVTYTYPNDFLLWQLKQPCTCGWNAASPVETKGNDNGV